MLGTVVNSIAIIVGSMLGLFIKGGIPERISNTIMNGLALCILYIGISGSFEGENTMVTIVCMALGGFIGELMNIDDKLNKLGDYIEMKVRKKSNLDTQDEICIDATEGIVTESISNNSISKGFVYASLIFCVGAMAVVGSLESGLQGNHGTLFAKSILDGISSIIFTASLGIGVMFSAAAVLIYQGIITLCAGFLSGVLSSAVISAMTAIGSLIIVGLGLNMLDATKIKVANLLPAIFIPIILGMVGIL